jgi:hypothetical protein
MNNNVVKQINDIQLIVLRQLIVAPVAPAPPVIVVDVDEIYCALHTVVIAIQELLLIASSMQDVCRCALATNCSELCSSLIIGDRRLGNVLELIDVLRHVLAYGVVDNTVQSLSDNSSIGEIFNIKVFIWIIEKFKCVCVWLGDDMLCNDE